MAAPGTKPPASGRIEGEDAIDEALEETFPASDSPPWTLGIERESALREREPEEDQSEDRK